MKKILLISLFPVLIFAQINRDILFIKQYQNATVLNGISQYWTKTSPSNLDLNGSEMISNANNTGFETNLGNWANFGNHSAVRSTVDKRTGTASMMITSSGAGDTTANFMYLPPSALGTMVAGNKYTVELWARSATATSTITLNIGTQSATSGTLSTTFGTFTKAVLSFQALTSTDTLKIYANKAIDSLYVDDVSLTQAYDAIVLTVASGTTPATTSQMILTVKDATVDATASAYYTIGVRNTNGFSRTFIYDGTTLVDGTSSTLAVNDGRYHLLATVYDRSGNASRYVDGAITGGGTTAITTLGKLSGMLTVLTRGSTSNQYWNGNIGAMQIIRFSSLPADGGASIIADAYNRFTRKKSFSKSYPNGTVVLDVDWKSGGTDKSGSNNHLTPVAGPVIVKVK